MLLMYLWSMKVAFMACFCCFMLILMFALPTRRRKYKKIEHKFRGSFCIALLLNMFLKEGEICKGGKFNSAYFQGEFALIVLALLHFACIQGEFAPQLCFEFELCAFC